MKTSILIRPAARGGKYLGPDAATPTNVSAIIALLNPISYKIISVKAVNTKNANAGPANLMDPIARSEPYATDDLTVNAVFTVDINEPTTYLIAVLGPMKVPDQQRITYTEITVLPGVDIGTKEFPEGIVVEIPGLCISNVSANLNGNQLSAFAQVTMMCGCKIAPKSSWLPTDFKVKLITLTQKGNTHHYDLDFDTNPANPSSFIGSWSNKAPSDPITKAYISAYEGKLGNQGFHTISGGLSTNSDGLAYKMQQFLIANNN